MSEMLKPTHTQPLVSEQVNPGDDEEMVNDSLGTVDPADSNGLDESKETGDAKRFNKNTHED